MTILTGVEIQRQRAAGAITIEPFDPARLNPNSYNFSLGDRLRAYTAPVLDARVENPSIEISITADGFVLRPGQLYLAATAEVLGGTGFAPTFAARSSIARLGLSIHLSSGLGDIGYIGQWTLQLVATEPVRVYPGMEIGQMMWWTPVGEINCYTGKYQGSRGPQTSRSWVGLTSDLARERFPGLGDAQLNEQLVGAKCARLGELSARVPVPPLIAVPAGEFAAVIEDDVLAGVEAVFADLRATVGAEVPAQVARLTDLIADIQLGSPAQELLAVRLEEVFAAGTRFAVRSSALCEDSTDTAYAGAYESVLDVADEDVPEAVAAVWRSYYSLTAVSARLRAGDLDPTPRMAVIVQVMVEPEQAGIAMTGLDPAVPDQVRIEAVRGRADTLAAGAAVPDHDGVLPPSTVAEVTRLVEAAREVLGVGDVDIEWVEAGGVVSLVQARPNTARRRHGSYRSEIAVVPLYLEPLPADIPLGPMTGPVGHFTSKRGPAMRRAHELGIAIGSAVVVYLPADPDHTWAEDLAPLLREAMTAPEVIVDVSEQQRQIVCNTDDLVGELQWLHAAAPAGEPFTVLVRDYVKGQRGLITHPADPATGEIAAESSDEGLLAMNRGFASTTSLALMPDSPSEAALAVTGGETNLALIARLARDLAVMQGPTVIEWVIGTRGELFYIDHTVLTGPTHSHTQPRMIAAGRATGHVVRVVNDAVLEQLSTGAAVSVSGAQIDVHQHRAVAEIITRIEVIRSNGGRVILSARRPYAVLAALVGLVDGFVFDLASQLCHLGIVVREHGIPALIHEAVDGDVLTLDNGTVLTHGDSR
ncbi:dCTP deaminase domain-containing protein [Nocardia puris]|uniref:Deoxycytidine triphosphate deaminase n=1 Tax=Nocardia puris TaxID=208602 RepID=A0A366DAJ8_9NOCA|nr:PEP/pyruvate-binding domain-containing protein [Nocardia puris]RBO86464.1 deoxycytidine triphosphate deaminase [Nocardia puris]